MNKLPWGELIMTGEELISCIWSGDIELRDGDDRSPLATLLDGILTVPTVSVVVASGLRRPVAFADSFEVMPGVSLGDALELELEFEVPLNSVILLEPRTFAAADEVCITDMGRDLGRVLTSIAAPALQQVEVEAPSVTLMPRRAGSVPARIVAR